MIDDYIRSKPIAVASCLFVVVWCTKIPVFDFLRVEVVYASQMRSL